MVFQKLVEIADPVERMRQLHVHLENSASWFYRQFEDRLSSVRTQSHRLEMADLLPESFACLRPHLRLESPAGSSVEPAWPDAVSILLEQEDLEETVVRLSCLRHQTLEGVGTFIEVGVQMFECGTTEKLETLISVF